MTAAAVLLKELYGEKLKTLKTLSVRIGKKMSNLFAFCEFVFADGQEILILITELTINKYSSHFISRYGCKEYFAHNKELLFYDRQKEIIRELQDLDLTE